MKTLKNNEGSASTRFSMIVAALILVGAATYFLSVLGFLPGQKEKPLTQFSSDDERMQGVLSTDMKNIQGDSGANDDEIANGMIRLAMRKDSEAKQQAWARRKSPSVIIRAGAAQAFGYFDDNQSFEALTELTSDDTIEVRVAAIEALASVPSAARLEAIRGILKRSGVTEFEQSAVWSALMRGESDPAARKEALEQLIRLATSAEDSRAREKSLVIASSYAPRDPAVLSALRRLIERESNHPLVPLALRQLAAARDAVVTKNLGNFLKSQNLQVRQAAVQSLHMVCPPNRWAVLEGILRAERDATPLWHSAIQELVLMPGADATKLMDKLESEKLISERQAPTAQSVRQTLSAAQSGSDPCQAGGPKG